MLSNFKRNTTAIKKNKQLLQFAFKVNVQHSRITGVLLAVLVHCIKIYLRLLFFNKEGERSLL